MDTINDRIGLIINNLGYNKNSFSKAIGLKNNTNIQNMFTGRKSGPSYGVVEKILLTFDSISAEWLLRGEGKMLKSECDISEIIQKGNIAKEESPQYGINWKSKYDEVKGELKNCKQTNEMLLDRITGNGTSG